MAELAQLFKFLNGFNPIMAKSKETLKNICFEVNLPKGNELQSIGHTCKTIYFVEKGLARIYYYKDGNDITETFAFENSLIARAESLFTGKPSKKGIQLLEDCHLIGIPSTELFNLYDQHHDIERLFRKIFESAYVETINRLESLQFHTAEERYKDLLHTSPNLLQRVPLKHIASYLGITQVSLSRIRAQI
jgi:CRP-like cAMP-binding protein